MGVETVAVTMIRPGGIDLGVAGSDLVIVSHVGGIDDRVLPTMFSVLYLIGSILVPVHFFTQIARLQVVVTNSPTANRVCQAIHGLWLGPVITATTEITKYASEQLYLMQANGVS